MALARACFRISAPGAMSQGPDAYDNNQGRLIAGRAAIRFARHQVGDLAVDVVACQRSGLDDRREIAALPACLPVVDENPVGGEGDPAVDLLVRAQRADSCAVLEPLGVNQRFVRRQAGGGRRLPAEADRACDARDGRTAVDRFRSPVAARGGAADKPRCGGGVRFGVEAAGRRAIAVVDVGGPAQGRYRSAHDEDRAGHPSGIGEARPVDTAAEA